VALPGRSTRGGLFERRGVDSRPGVHLSVLAPFPHELYAPDMADSDNLRVADPGVLEQALAHALQFDGRRQFRVSGEMMAKITAAHLAEQLRRAGFVVMQRPPGAALHRAKHWVGRRRSAQLGRLIGRGFGPFSQAAARAGLRHDPQ
jgi:hypothetical protein